MSIDPSASAQKIRTFLIADIRGYTRSRVAAIALVIVVLAAVAGARGGAPSWRRISRRSRGW